MVRVIRALEPNTALRGISPVRRKILRGAPIATSAHLLKLFVGLSALAEFAAWREKKLETAKAESKPRELVHARRCDPTKLFPVLSQIRAHLAH